MTDVASWLQARRPEPPEELWSAVELERLGSAADVTETLAAAAAGRSARARAHPGRIRQSAFELLVADALLTYACEAALEQQDAEQVLTRLVGECSAP